MTPAADMIPKRSLIQERATRLRERGAVLAAAACKNSTSCRARCKVSCTSRIEQLAVSCARLIVRQFDDFIAVHIIQALKVHYTGSFLPWHRWLLYNYEQALRNECGYTGYQPYWDWPKYAAAPQNSPLLDGSRHSMSGNGEFEANNTGIFFQAEDIFVGGQNVSTIIHLPVGLGGGYVETGPFANMSVNLGPVWLSGVPPGPDGGLGHNPRRLKRDINPTLATRFTNYTAILELLTAPNISEYRLHFEGVPFTPNIAINGGGHYTIGGDPGGDAIVALGDPAVFIHEGGTDRAWSIWQFLDPFERFTEPQMNGGQYGHITLDNNPPTRRARFDDVLNIEYAGENTTIGDVISTVSGPFCYFYL